MIPSDPIPIPVVVVRVVAVGSDAVIVVRKLDRPEGRTVELSTKVRPGLAPGADGLLHRTRLYKARRPGLVGLSFLLASEDPAHDAAAPDAPETTLPPA